MKKHLTSLIFLTALSTSAANAQNTQNNPHPCAVMRSCRVVTGGVIDWSLDSFRLVENVNYVNVTMVGKPDHVTFRNVLISNGSVDMEIPNTSHIERVEFIKNKIKNLTINNAIVNSLFLTGNVKEFAPIAEPGKQQQPNVPFLLTVRNTLMVNSIITDNVVKTNATGAIFSDTMFKNNDMRKSNFQNARANNLLLNGNNLTGSILSFDRSYKAYLNGNDLRGALLPTMPDSGVIYSNNVTR